MRSTVIGPAIPVHSASLENWAFTPDEVTGTVLAGSGFSSCEGEPDKPTRPLVQKGKLSISRTPAIAF
jgi:hypothetical protein